MMCIRISRLFGRNMSNFLQNYEISLNYRLSAANVSSVSIAMSFHSGVSHLIGEGLAVYPQ